MGMGSCLPFSRALPPLIQGKAGNKTLRQQLSTSEKSKQIAPFCTKPEESKQPNAKIIQALSHSLMKRLMHFGLNRMQGCDVDSKLVELGHRQIG
jgi:hypothetical protein